MDFSYLFSSIVAESVGKTVDKLNFKRNKIDPRQILLVVFIIMTATVLLYAVLVPKPFPTLPSIAIAFLVGIALFSFVGNIFDEISLQKADLSLREPLVNFEPVATGLIAYALFPEERKPIFLVAFILCAVIVHWGINRRKLQKSEKRGMFYLLIAVAIYSVIPIFYKGALDYLSPTYIALVRLSAVTVLVMIFFRPKRSQKLTGKMLSYSTFSGVAYGIGAIVSLYAIQAYGLVLTMLFLMLGPALRYLASYFILKENVRKGEVVSSLALAVVVAMTAFATHS